jgi:sterol desaturase/sphingolipid hydroxylase (fatty acid hydroxylase superfamily)
MHWPMNDASLRAAFLFGGFFLVAAWELVQPRRSEALDFHGRWLGNVTFYLVNSGLMMWLLPEPSSARGPIEATIGVSLPQWPIADAALTLIAGFVVCDLLRYGLHRLEHAVPFLWRFHALHHSDPDLDVTTALRHHPIEIVIGSAILWIGFIVLDMPPVVILVYGIALTTMAALQHGNVRLPARLDSWLQLVFVTTDMHRVHHAMGFVQANSNYGAVFSIWDRVFNTFARLAPHAQETIVFGIRELRGRQYQTLSAMIVSPWLLARSSNTRGSVLNHVIAPDGRGQ